MSSEEIIVSVFLITLSVITPVIIYLANKEEKDLNHR